jgi:2-polyprenyl-6-hydroxyphenyl methylase / 3-demethylubiquinone-9 3-methyltransferase
MAVDNEVYDRLGDGWWDQRNPLNVLHGSMTPGRMSYLREVLARAGAGSDGRPRTLDVGCGGGFLAEELARLGHRVVGVDPSLVSLRTARRHAAGGGLQIDYRHGVGEDLPAGDAEFDLVLCCDVLEHVDDPDAVVAEIARVLRPGGLFFFDTVNRTSASRLLVVKAMQEWRWTRITDAAVHDWAMFLTPAELSRLLDRHGLDAGELVGLAPRCSALSAVLQLVAARRGRITYGELSRRLDMGKVTTLSLAYMGSATRR